MTVDREKALEALAILLRDIGGKGYDFQLETIRAALTAPDAVDVEALKREVRSDFFGTSFEPPDDFDAHLALHGDKVIDNLKSKGILRTADAGLGTAEQAIDFALKNIDDAWTDRCAFLEAWQHGDISEWPEYKAMIAEVKK